MATPYAYPAQVILEFSAYRNCTLRGRLAPGLDHCDRAPVSLPALRSMWKQVLATSSAYRLKQNFVSG